MNDLARLKKEKNALIIAHYYQEPEIQDVADYVGDSLGMALYANKQKCKIAVVAGVKFMAETIKVLNPRKKILLPDLNAGCSLADSCTPEIFKYFLSKHPGVFVMTYVNSSLEIKALSDVICTSSNALKIARQIPADQQIIFGPDQHLGRFIMKKLGRPMILFPGNCFVHMSFSAKEMVRLKERYPDSAIIAHPECQEVVLNHAEFVGSTSQLLKFTQESPKKRFIVMTEEGIIHQMKKASPDKEFIPGPDLEGCSCNQCPHMKLNTMEKLIDCLEKEEPEIVIKPQLAKAALKPLQKMVEMTKK
ncbi:MAG: quinolinate synthase NadA [Deltaproteobacteria bacterium]|nr:quinolinate synthase NadA [Deltaproteobacteria bacterium]